MNLFLLKEKWIALGVSVLLGNAYAQNQNAESNNIAPWSNDSQWLYSAMTSRFANHAGDYQSAIANISDVAEKSKQYDAYKYSYNLALDALDLEKGEKIAQEWVAQFPKNDEAQFALIRIFLMNQDIDQSKIEIERLLSREDGLNIIAQISRLLTYLPDADQRIDILSQLLKKHPKNPYIAYYLGIAAKEQGDIYLAITAFNQALSINGKWKELEILQAESLSSIGQFEEAKKMLDQLRSKYRDDLDLLFSEINILMDHYQWQDAIALTEKWKQLSPHDNQAAQLLAWLYSNAGDYEKAKQSYESLLREGVLDNNQFSYQVGQAALNSKKYKQAEAFLNTVNQNSNLYMLARQQVGMMHFLNKDIAQAQESFARLREQFPDYALEMYIVEITNLDKLSAFEEAGTTLDQALVQYPNQIDLLFAKAEHLSSINDIEEASKVYQQIIALDSANIDAINAYGYLLLTKTDQKAEAEKLIIHALQKYQDSPAIQDSYAWMLYLRGEKEKALKWIRRAYAAYRRDEIVAHYVEILNANGKKELAQTVYESEIIGQPENPYLKKIGKKLGLANDH